ncbi:MAG: molybdopterin molybdotransferase MoeA [Bacteroidetes bacterium]|nr:molybdopterin molybdotransferase MoeA [Bacteroidota bacterium]
MQRILFRTGICPPFDKSAMDGFACRREDLENRLDIIGEIPAGIEYKGSIGQNQCVRIMTGAMVPAGADYVLMKEDAEEIEPGKILSTRKKAGENICYKGEDLKPGDIVIPKGTLIQPASIAMLASVGNVYPLVYRQPSVAVVSTGSELVEPWESPSSACIRNSNAYQLMAQLQTMNINARYLGIVADNESKIEETLTGAIESFDVVIISGGVSVGDFDFVPRILSKLGVKALFHGMNVKPGKHLLFGRKGNCSVFGMPGNPVSSFVQFLLLVQPLILKLSGSTKRNNTAAHNFGN